MLKREDQVLYFGFSHVHLIGYMDLSVDASLFHIRVVFLAVAICAQVYIVCGKVYIRVFPAVASYSDKGEIYI
jgi:hypothetical protein